MKIAIANDHGAVNEKKEILEYLEQKGIVVEDFGTNSFESTNYPEYAKVVSKKVVNEEVDLGILICGTGVGMSLAANKVRGIRAVVCSDPYSAKLSKEHNDTNILCFGARVVGIELAKMIVDEWLGAEFEGGRHKIRIDMISEMEKKL